VLDPLPAVGAQSDQFQRAVDLAARQLLQARADGQELAR